MKIVVDNAIPYIQGRLPEDVEVIYKAGNEIGPEDVCDADAVVVRTRTKCDASLLGNSTVKHVATATIGTDHIDTGWCMDHGISVRNAPGCNAPGVAQYVLSSLLHTGFDPKTMTLGIIGHGNVGKVVADWASELGIKTLISDAPKQSDGFKDADYKDMEEVLRRSDAVTLHVPFTASGDFPTRYMIGERELGMMRQGAILVNSSRGGVVEEKALKKTLKSGGLKAIVDVWENEPYIDPELASLVSIATPHIAGYSREGKMRATRMALEALRDELGIKADLTGLLDKDLKPDGFNITLDGIERSYDPAEDTTALRGNLANFENLRNKYSYRTEP